MADTLKSAATVSEGLDRRRFLTWVMASPTLMIAARLGLDVPEAEAAEPPEGATTTLSLSLAVQTDGRVVTTLPRTEMGQGITTAVAMLVAEELDMALDTVDVRSADADPRWVIQLTGLSSTMRFLTGPCAPRRPEAGRRPWSLPP
ncbi:molybdopterin cofactor-binding domain-containing protein, partial [Myxococcus sp. 1LA]